jgi:hypothetical protein
MDQVRMPTKFRRGLTPEERAYILPIERLRSRSGNFLAFYRYACFTDESTPQRLERMGQDEMHLDMARAMTSFLRCARVDEATGETLGCGKYHLQDPIARDANQNLIPIKCPYCGLEDCAGPQRVGEEGFKGRGATLMMKKVVAYMVGYLRSLGYSPKATLIAANFTEGAERLEWINKTMKTPEYLYTFGHEAVPAEGARGTLHIGPEESLVGQAYGWESAPDGHHVDIVVVDDACNQNTSMLNPKDRELLKNKIIGTAFQGIQPWTLILYLSNAWVEGDVTSELHNQAKKSPQRWRWTRRFMGGPPDFRSPWKKFTPAFLEGEYNAHRRAFERGFMGKRISEDEIAFREIHYWVGEHNRTYSWAKRLCEGYPALDDHSLRLLDWPKVYAIDPGFSKSKDTKGRSMTGRVAITMNPETGQGYTLFAACGMMALDSGLLIQTVRDDTEKFGCTVVVPEGGGPQNLFPDLLEKAGFQVYAKTPEGAKSARKWDIAAAVNEGRILLRGWPMQGDGKAPGRVECYNGQEVLEQAMRNYPMESDVLDAFENAWRQMWALYGTGSWAGLPATAGRSQETTFMRWLDAQCNPVNRESEEDVRVAVDDGEPENDAAPVAVGGGVFIDMGNHFVLQN